MKQPATFLYFRICFWWTKIESKPVLSCSLKQTDTLVGNLLIKFKQVTKQNLFSSIGCSNQRKRILWRNIKLKRALLLVSMQAYLIAKTGNFINDILLVLLAPSLRLRPSYGFPIILAMNFGKSVMEIKQSDRGSSKQRMLKIAAHFARCDSCFWKLFVIKSSSQEKSSSVAILLTINTWTAGFC